MCFVETGRPLRLSAVWTDNNVVNVSCGSEGWYPKPYLRWSDQNGALTPESVQHGNDSPGLLSVHSWLLVRSSSDIICTVGLQGGEEKESTLHLSQLPQTGQRASHSKAHLLQSFTATQKLTTLPLFRFCVCYRWAGGLGCALSPRDHPTWHRLLQNER